MKLGAESLHDQAYHHETCLSLQHEGDMIFQLETLPSLDNDCDGDEEVETAGTHGRNTKCSSCAPQKLPGQTVSTCG